MNEEYIKGSQFILEQEDRSHERFMELMRKVIEKNSPLAHLEERVFYIHQAISSILIGTTSRRRATEQLL